MISILSKTKTVVGIEIKPDYIRFVEIEYSDKKQRIISYGEIIFETLLFENNVFIDEKKIIEYLKNIKKEVLAKDFIVSLPNDVDLKTFTKIFKDLNIKVSNFVRADDALDVSIIPNDSNLSFLVIDAEKKQVNFLIHSEGEKTFYYEGAPEKHYVATNLNQIYIDWYDDHKEKIHNVLLCGSRLSDEAFVDYIGSQTKIPISFANVFVNLELDDQEIPVIPKEESCKYGVAIGLCILGSH